MKIIGLTGIRGGAIAIIVIYHLNQIRPIQDLALWDWKIYQFISLLPVVVSIFFLLGGFLRSLSYWKVVYNGEPVPPFWKGVQERFLRIAPLYYLALIASFLWTLSLGYPDWMSFLASFTFLNWIHPTTFFPNMENGPLWFVAYDMMGNLLVMTCMSSLIFLRRSTKIHTGVLIAFSFTLWFIFLLLLHQAFLLLPFPKGEGVVSVWFPYYNPFIFGIYYLFGAFMAGIYLHLGKNGFGSHSIYDGIFLLSISMIAWYLYSIRGAGDLDYSIPTSPYRFPLIPLLFALSIFSLIFTRFFGKFLDNAILLFLAKISYPLYLFHALIISILVEFFYKDGFTSFREWTIFSTIVIILSIALSMLFSRIESYALKRFFSR